ncbi:MAG TPA: sigma-54-dependent Fis family transcriptional regulator, partial [Thermoanaerobaculia bacterium]|nr:sigma-54-dependent Fis family transcriptional regulator [Thermoanaerobaculia bacterium]
MLRVVVTYENRVAKAPLRDRPLTIGSAVGNDVVVSCLGVSRRHAVVTRRADTVVIEDLGSKNGLLLAGRRVARADLLPGTTVQLGRAQLRVEEVSSSDAVVGLSIDNRTSSHAIPLDGTTSLSAAGAPGAALAWARAAEAAGDGLGGAQRAELLRSACQIGGWDALALCERADNDVALQELHGVLTTDLPRGEDGQWMLATLSPRSYVAAHAIDVTMASWRRDFLEYVALKMFARDRDRADIPSAEGPLAWPEEMVPAESAAMRAIYDDLRAAAASDLPILLRGESGTGKELLARIVHASSASARGPFRALNCAAIPAELLEAELFGIRKGVATGVDARQGLFVEAAGRTVFLDEIGDMPPKLQAKLLRVLQEREVQPLGTSSPVKIDVRIVASTNRDLVAMLAGGAFRSDLYYRLRGIELTIPPLR